MQIVECSIKIELVRDNWTELKGEIAGPPETPYAGGKFELEIKVPETYPFNPPKVRFITKIWHPNISSVTGAICLDILKENWAAAMTLRTVLLSLQALLSAAEPDDPQDAVVATQYKENYEMFKLTAMNWTTAYANGGDCPFLCPPPLIIEIFPGPPQLHELDGKVKRLTDMGVKESDARAALSRYNWDIERATHHLFS